MYKGFYTLTSGMLTQNRNLNVVTNNLTNVSTPGFKKDTFISGAFQEEMYSRLGNKNKANPAELAELSMIRASLETVTNFSQGGFDQTEDVLDFALSTNGFFQIQGAEGNVYTRNGAFIVDEEGYLSLPQTGRVLGSDGNTIYLGTDNFSVSQNGTIYDSQDVVLGQIGVVDFNDYTMLTKFGEGMFQSTAQPAPVEQPGVMWKMLERSNINPLEEMTDALQSQRALQSASQILKMYDQIMAKATTDIGRI